MKYLITMKDGTVYLDDQPDSWLDSVAGWMADGELGLVHLSLVGGFVVRCSEIAHVEVVADLQPGEGESCH